MPQSTIRVALLCACLMLGANAQFPLAAQTFEELDALSDASADEKAALQLARQQATSGEYLEALATLERMLAEHPKSREGRLLHALYLCYIDDARGGLLEIDRLKTKHYGEELLEEARQMCREAL